MSNCVVRVAAQFLLRYSADFGKNVTGNSGRCFSEPQRCMANEHIEKSLERRRTSAKLSHIIHSNAFDVSKSMYLLVSVTFGFAIV